MGIICFSQCVINSLTSGKTLLPYFCLGTHTPCTRYAALILLSPRRRVASARRPCRPAKRAGAACFPSRPAGPSWCGAWAPAGSPPRPRCPPERRGVRRSALAPRDAVRGGSGRRPPRSRTRPSPRLGQNGAEQAPLHQRHSMPGGWHLGAASLGHSASLGPRWPLSSVALAGDIGRVSHTGRHAVPGRLLQQRRLPGPKRGRQGLRLILMGGQATGQRFL